MSVGLQWGEHHSHPIAPSTDSIPPPLESNLPASRLAELPSHPHSHGHAHSHAGGHSHHGGHSHSHDASHSHETETSHVEGEIVGSHLHSHIRFFGMEFIVLTTTEQHERDSVSMGLHQRTKNLVLRVLLIRSPLPPTGDHFLRSHQSDWMLLANSLVPGCEHAEPLVPPPQAI
ncbi:hypothetical protein [Rhodopirellula islandica]|uniref:hypothetical protein n=1 Tax=Rhodopirellula islandica TaxID=595434 RepID=UPI001F3512F5|nr:hypothetical protein [Rhodopirellula islandica]